MPSMMNGIEVNIRVVSASSLDSIDIDNSLRPISNTDDTSMDAIQNIAIIIKYFLRFFTL